MEDPDVCPICLEPGGTEKVCPNECAARFHAPCVRQLDSDGPKAPCPTCRAPRAKAPLPPRSFPPVATQRLPPPAPPPSLVNSYAFCILLTSVLGGYFICGILFGLVLHLSYGFPLHVRTRKLEFNRTTGTCLVERAEQSHVLDEEWSELTWDIRKSGTNAVTVAVYEGDTPQSPFLTVTASAAFVSGEDFELHWGETVGPAKVFSIAGVAIAVATFCPLEVAFLKQAVFGFTIIMIAILTFLLVQKCAQACAEDCRRARVSAT